MQTLTCPLAVFRQVLRQLALTPTEVVPVQLGRHSRSEGTEWLVRDIVKPEARQDRQGDVLRIASAEKEPERRALPPDTVGELVLGRGAAQGRIWGQVTDDEGMCGLDHICLPGAGMHRLRVSPLGGAEPSVSALASSLSSQDRVRWSRTIGAIGSPEAWQRLTALCLVIVGCGRSGSAFALAAARLGFSRIILVDPDRVEAHNVGEMEGITVKDVGALKAEALASALATMRTDERLRVTALAERVQSARAIQALKEADVIVCCADRDAARLASAFVAAFYHRVLLDVGTGVPRDGDGRAAGADIRLIVPGDGCLLCRGGLTDQLRAIAELAQMEWAMSQPFWRAQRAGSLASVNQIAVGLGIQMLIDLVAERLTGSTWLHMAFDAQGRLQVEYPLDGQQSSVFGCSLCARAGLGDTSGLP